MKWKCSLLLAGALWSATACRAVHPTPFVFYTVDLAGEPTNAPVVIKGFSGTNEIVGVGTNIVLAGFQRTYIPVSGVVTGALMPGNYRLSVPLLNRAVTFGITESTNVQNLAQLAGFPVVQFMNFTVAQFSDAGTMAYTNAAEFLTLSTNIANGQIAANAPGFGMLSGTNEWTGTNYFDSRLIATNPANTIGGVGAALTGLNAAALADGTVADARIGSGIPRLAKTNEWTGDNTFLGVVLVSNRAGAFEIGTLLATNITGTFGLVTGGVWYAGAISSPAFTNAVNYGNAFSSPGAGGNSQQYGSGAEANGVFSIALGYTAQSHAQASVAIGSPAQVLSNAVAGTAIGNLANAWAQGGTAVGSGAVAAGTNSSAIGKSADAFTNNATALGADAQALHLNSTAIGYAAATTRPNQTVIGSGAVDVDVAGRFFVAGGSMFAAPITNLTVSGTNQFPAGADVSFGRFANASLANGNNAAVLVGTNVFVEVSGPTGAFTINGIDGAPNRDGKIIILLNRTGQDMTLAHESGVDPTAANRIVTMTGADRTTTGNGAAILIYHAAAARWMLISFDP